MASKIDQMCSVDSQMLAKRAARAAFSRAASVSYMPLGRNRAAAMACIRVIVALVLSRINALSTTAADRQHALFSSRNRV